MTDSVRRLNDAGIDKFREFITMLRAEATLPVPSNLLQDPAYSAPTAFSATVSNDAGLPAFTSRYEFGCYLVGCLAAADKNVISRDQGLWAWLALYFFDFICERDGAERFPDEDAVYVLPRDFSFRRYYRHMVRSPWWAAGVHGEKSKVLLAPRKGTKQPLTTRGEIFEQLASRQNLFGSKVVIESAYQLYFDETSGHPKGRTGGSAGGSPRRLADVLNQLDLTYDIGGDVPDVVVARLPKEFSHWKGPGGKAA